MNNFDIAKMTDHATDYYFFIADKVAVRQDNLFRAYLWVASLLFTLDVLIIKDLSMPLSSATTIFAIGTLFLLVVALAICVWSMRGTQAVQYPSILEYVQQEAAAPEQMWTQEQLLADFWGATQHEKADRTKRGLRLRDISLCLTFAIFLMAIAAVLYLLEGR